MKVALLSFSIGLMAGCSAPVQEAPPRAPSTDPGPSKPIQHGALNSKPSKPHAVPPKNAPRPSGEVVTSRARTFSMRIPKGWYSIDPKNKAFRAKFKAMGRPEAISQYASAASKTELLLMDLDSPGPTRRNMNVIKLGSNPKSDGDLEGAFAAVSDQVSGGMDHTLLAFPAGHALCYWGIAKSGDTQNGLVGYALSIKGHAHIFSFACSNEDLAKFRAVTDGMMASLKVK